MLKLMFGNRKGGTLKTSSSVSISHAITLLGKKVLLIDADPQGNTTEWLKPETHHELADTLYGKNKVEFKDIIIKLNQGFDLIPTFSDGYLSQVAETELLHRPFTIEDLMKEIENQYDFIIFDTSPSFSALERAVCLASNEVIIPVELEYFAVQGLSNFDESVKQLNKDMKRNTQIKRVLLTRANYSFSRHKFYLQEIQKYNYTFHIVRQDSEMAEAIGYHKTIFEYNNLAKTASDYMSIAKELIA